MKNIPLCKPYLPEEVIEEIQTKINKVLISGHLTQGKVVDEFEECAKEYIGCKYAIAVTNCTVGMEIALRILELNSEDDVIVPSYTHPATYQAVRSVQANPILVDVVKETALLDFDKVKERISSDTKVIMPVSLFGNPLNRHYIEEVVHNNIYIIEDAACGLGSSYMNTKTGNFPGMTVFSFHPRKIITTGEGGLITTNDEGIAEKIEAYRNFGGYKNLMGTNAKMSDINAAIGVVQFKYLDRLLDERQSLASYYEKKFKDTTITPLKTTLYGEHSYQSFVVLVPNAINVIKQLKKYNIESQVGSYTVENYKNYPNTSCLKEQTLSLPLYYGMTREDQNFVIDNLMEIIENE